MSRSLHRFLFANASLALLALRAASGQSAARRPVSDPGVVTTGQHVAPAGTESVFDGRVYGVRFGASGNDLWVLVSGAAGGSPSLMHLDWSDNRVLSRTTFSGTPGMQGLALDPSSGRPLMSFVSTVPATANRAAMRAARLGIADGDSLKVIADRLGTYAVGAVGVARGEDASRRRLAVVPLTHDDSAAIVDLGTGAVLRMAPTGIAPFGAAIDSAGTTAFVTNWGGRRPVRGDRTSPTGIAPGADQVVVDARGIASTGSVTRIDVPSGRAMQTIGVGLHPTALVWDEQRGRVYVADGNADAVSVIDVASNRVERTMAIAPFTDRTSGLAPTALALSPDGTRLFVALGGINAVAVIEASSGRLSGMIPTAWYPNSLSVSADGAHLAIGALLGAGSGSAPPDLVKRFPDQFVATARYVHAVRGSVTVVAVPDEAKLADYTRAVAANSRLTLTSDGGSSLLLPRRAGIAPRAVPERHGEPSLIQHVVYIIKENRTYDQLFGDIAKGNGDPALTMYGDSITPNHHRLAEQFVLLDNFFATGGNSGDGHQWVTQANETDYAMWPGYAGRSYPFDGADPIAPAAGGFLWDAVRAGGATAQIFGEYAGLEASTATAGLTRLARLDEYRRGAPMSYSFHTVAPNRSVNAILAHDFPGYGGVVPDVIRAKIFRAHLEQWIRGGTMPNLAIIQLPSDHTAGLTPDFSTPAACLADNDLALGQIVDALSHSPFWKSMAIFVVEDDAQGAVDHVDGHRTVALAISPYIKRGSVDHTTYAHQSMLKTIELMLGVKPLSVFDLIAPDMRASFVGPNESPDLTPYRVVEPRQSIYDRNPRVSQLTGPERQAAVASSKMRFDVPDAAPSEALNRILWHAARGWSTTYPAVKHALFFPLSIDTDDDDREERGERSARARRK